MPPKQVHTGDKGSSNAHTLADLNPSIPSSPGLCSEGRKRLPAGPPAFDCPICPSLLPGGRKRLSVAACPAKALLARAPPSLGQSQQQLRSMEKAWSLCRGGNRRREATALGCKYGDTEEKLLNTAPAHSHTGGSFPATFVSAHWSPSTPPNPTGDFGQEGRPRGSCIRRQEGRRRAGVSA